MLDAPETLLFRSNDELAILNQSCCRVTMVGIETEYDHASKI
jgi:hypothetical protein